MPFAAILLLLFASCASAAVLNIPAAEAETLLSAGDITFILDGRLKKMGELSRIAPQAPFYAGLLVEEYALKHKEDEEAPFKARALFESALTHTGARIESANKLVSADPDFYGEDFCRAAPKSLASTTAGMRWEAAFALLNAAAAADAEVYAEDVRAYFFSREFSAAPARQVAEWLFARLEQDRKLPLDEPERAVVKARFACAIRDWPAAYRQFRRAFPRDAEEAGVPALILRYPALLNDFGRACQYGGGLSEGAGLFAAYDAALKTAADAEERQYLRYLTNYYLGRFSRAVKAYPKAVDAFNAAAVLAPDDQQKDACVWYILDMQYTQQPRESLAWIKKYAPRWSDPAYFDDILGNLAFYCAGKKNWQYLLDLFTVVRVHGSQAAQAKYAYIIARALEEGYLKTTMEGITRDALLAVAYEQESDYYYRAMAAQRLKKEPGSARLWTAAGGETDSLPEDGEAMRFLLDFFRFGCARFASAYINARYDTLSVPQLRLLAKKLSEAGRYGDAIRLVVKYGGRADYEPTRADMELSYPRAFRDLVERYAQKTQMKENYLYALMRTESIFIPDIVSRAGALGLTQLMPATGRQMAEILAQKGGPNYIEDGEIDLLEPERNIHLGALYYKDMEYRMGSAQSALLAYNGGIGRVRAWKRTAKNLPDDLFAETIELQETREYSKKVIGGAVIYEWLYYGAAPL